MNESITVITICYNAANVLPLTMESVLAQEYTDFEYIVEDGESTDETPNIVEGYRERFESKGIRFIYNRKGDLGIYDAMNKGVASSSGGFINFMNAGDCFYGPDVLGKIADLIVRSHSEGHDPAIIYGDCAMFEYGRFYLFRKSCDSIEERMPFSHQSVFARRDLLETHPFDTGYRYSADYDFLLTVHDLREEFLDAGIIVCIASADGLTSIHYRQTVNESTEILKAHGIYRPGADNMIAGQILALKQFVMDRFPVPVRKMIRSRQIKKRGQDFTPEVPVWFKDHIN